MALIHFLHVKEGACSIIQHEDNKVSMIDVCSASNIAVTEKASILAGISENFSVTETVNPKGNFSHEFTNPTEYLANLRVNEIFRYIQTHPDMDHMDGLASIRETFFIRNFWDIKNNKEKPKFPNPKGYKEEDWDCYQMLRSSKESPKSLNIYAGEQGLYYSKDKNGVKKDDVLLVLSPNKALVKDAEKQKNWNCASYVLLYKSHGYKILFGGDADENTMDYILEHFQDEVSNIDVLIAPHHGRACNQDFTYLKHMNPKLVLIGDAPSQYLNYFDGYNHLTTNQGGNILIETSPRKLNVYIDNATFAVALARKNNQLTIPTHPNNKGLYLYQQL